MDWIVSYTKILCIMMQLTLSYMETVQFVFVQLVMCGLIK